MTATNSSPNHIPQLRFTAFDAPWNIRQVSEIATVKHGYAFKGEFFADSGTYVVLTPGNFQLGGGFRHQGDKEKFYSDPNFPKDYILKQGDLITAMTEQAVGLIGSPLVVPEDGKFLHNQRLGLFQFTVGQEAGFLYFAMQTSSLRREFSNSAAGSKVRHTSPKRIESLPLKIPALPEQRKIAEFLTAVDGRIQQLIQKKALLEDYKKGVMQQLFTQAIRFKDDDGNEFPDWEEKELGEFIDERKDVASSNLPLYSLTIESGIVPKSKRYERSFLVKSEDGAYKRMKPKDFAYNPMNLRWGALACHHGDCEIAVSKYYDVFSVNEKSAPEYLEPFLTSYRMLQFYDRMSTGTLTEKKRVHYLDFVHFKKLFPTLPEQTKIADFLSAIDRKIDSVATQITETKTFKRGLLQQMFV